ncbi:hypothetical protein HA402_006602 [Bradysia odoriphaga]|nr:hypothetical protein HA402_006602 [Bradysia odoriphaga]
MNVALIILIITTLPNILAEQKFVIEPEDVTAVLGTHITLPCRVTSKQGVLQWTKDDFGLGTHRNLSAFERYSMVGNDDDGDYSLKIESVGLEDDAKFQCQVSPGPEGQPGIRSNFATLTVVVPPEPPIISHGEFYLATEGHEFELECSSTGGKPAAELTWLDGSGNTITTGVRNIKEPMPDNQRFVSKSILKIKPQKEHHNTTLTCQSQNTADRNLKTAQVNIEVKYAPTVQLTIENSNEPNNGIREGDEAKFYCLADANPNVITYKWFVNEELVVGDYTTEMIIHRVNRSHHTATVKCEVSNDIGEAEESTILNVIYPPVFKSSPKSVEADLKEEINLECDVDGNPLEIVWLNFHPRVVGTTNNLKIIVSNETAGRYYCKASVIGFPEIKSEANVYVKQAPKIESPSKQYGAKGDTLRLECIAFSVPKARHISWSFNGMEINTMSDRDYSILEDPSSPRLIKSTLIIRDSQDWHFGKYNCTVVNDYGVDVLQIDLMYQYNFQFLMIIVGATLVVITLVILVVLFLCCKLKRKTNQENNDEKLRYSDDDLTKHKISDRCWKESDGSSHSSDYKPDIKQGSSESDYSIASTNCAGSTLDIKERRGGSVPLAGPVDFPISYRHSAADYADTVDGYYPPKYVPNNYGYITHTDYARYCLPPTQKYATNRHISSSATSMDNNYIRSGNAIRQDNGLPAGNRGSLIV